jgi:hypothetical protein
MCTSNIRIIFEVHMCARVRERVMGRSVCTNETLFRVLSDVMLSCKPCTSMEE